MTEQAEGYLAKQLTARKSTVNFYLANNLISDIKEISELFGLNVPRNWDFKNYELSRQKVYTIQNAQ
jgi:phage-related holin